MLSSSFLLATSWIEIPAVSSKQMLKLFELVSSRSIFIYWHHDLVFISIENSILLGKDVNLLLFAINNSLLGTCEKATQLHRRSPFSANHRFQNSRPALFSYICKCHHQKSHLFFMSKSNFVRIAPPSFRKDTPQLTLLSPFLLYYKRRLLRPIWKFPPIVEAHQSVSDRRSGSIAKTFLSWQDISQYNYTIFSACLLWWTVHFDIRILD